MYAGNDETLIEEDSVHSISASLISGREGTKCLDRRAPVRKISLTRNTCSILDVDGILQVYKEYRRNYRSEEVTMEMT